MAEANFQGATEGQTFQPPVGTHTVVGNGVDAQGKIINPKAGPGPQMNKPTTSQKLSKIQPSKYALDTFLRNIGSGETRSDKFEFYSVVSRGIACKTAEAAAIKTREAVVMKLSEGCHSLSVDGDLLVPTYNVANEVATKVAEGVAAPHPLVLHICAINIVDKTVTVVGVNGSCESLEPETEMYRMASAKDQDAAISSDPHATPTKESNYCQRNICTISENVFQALQEKEVQYGMTEFKEQALFDFRYQAEVTSIFGGKMAGNTEFIDPVSQKRKLHLRGLMDFNIQTVARGGTDVDEFLNNVMQQLFSANNGSEERLFMYGPGVATMLANSDKWRKMMDASKTLMKWGVTWKQIESNFGLLNGVMSPVLGLLGPYTNCAFIIDPANIRRIDQVKLHQRVLKLQEAGIRNSNDVMLEESWTLECTNPTTHGFISF